MYMSRLKNVFKQEQTLVAESIKHIEELKEENKKLVEQVEQLRLNQNRVKDVQTVINELVEKYF